MSATPRSTCGGFAPARRGMWPWCRGHPRALDVAMVARYSHTDITMMRKALGLVDGVYSPLQIEA